MGEMSKPEEAPERKVAWDIYFARCDATNRLAQDFEEEEVIDLLARALMAAKYEERRYCLDIVEEIAGTPIGTGDAKTALGHVHSAIKKRGKLS